MFMRQMFYDLCGISIIWKKKKKIGGGSPSFSYSTELAHSCPCQRCERRWEQPAVTMCSCISDFLSRDVLIKMKGKVLRKRSERWRASGRQMRSVHRLPNKRLCNWADFLSACFSACLVHMFDSDNISLQWYLFIGHQFYLSSLFYIAPCESLPCCFFHDTDDYILLLSWIFRNGTWEMQNVHIAALHRFWFLAWLHFSTHTLGTYTLHFTAMCIAQLYLSSSCAWCHLSRSGFFFNKDIHQSHCSEVTMERLELLGNL